MKTKQEITISEPATTADWEQYYALRFQVLRQPWQQPAGSEKLPDDDTAMHALLKDETGRVMAVCRLNMRAPDTGQLRMMAVHPEAQGKGYGRLLVQWLEHDAQQMGATRMVLEAREGAVPFYEKIGYEVVKKSYLLFGSIQHYFMAKALGSAAEKEKEV